MFVEGDMCVAFDPNGRDAVVDAATIAESDIRQIIKGGVGREGDGFALEMRFGVKGDEHLGIFVQRFLTRVGLKLGYTAKGGQSQDGENGEGQFWFHAAWDDTHGFFIQKIRGWHSETYLSTSANEMNGLTWTRMGVATGYAMKPTPTWPVLKETERTKPSA